MQALSQAVNVNVRTQLLPVRIMERNDLEVVSVNDERKLYNDNGIKQAFLCGFFMQVSQGQPGVESLRSAVVRPNCL